MPLLTTCPGAHRVTPQPDLPSCSQAAHLSLVPCVVLPRGVIQYHGISSAHAEHSAGHSSFNLCREIVRQVATVIFILYMKKQDACSDPQDGNLIHYHDSHYICTIRPDFTSRGLLPPFLPFFHYFLGLYGRTVINYTTYYQSVTQPEAVIIDR